MKILFSVFCFPLSHQERAGSKIGSKVVQNAFSGGNWKILDPELMV
jgi:hypothetical protein